MIETPREQAPEPAPSSLESLGDEAARLLSETQELLRSLSSSDSDSEEFEEDQKERASKSPLTVATDLPGLAMAQADGVKHSRKSAESLPLKASPSSVNRHRSPLPALLSSGLSDEEEGPAEIDGPNGADYDDESLELEFDAAKGCYFDPSTGRYYDILADSEGEEEAG